MGRVPSKKQRAAMQAQFAKRDACIAAGSHGKKTNRIGFGIFCAECNHRVDIISEQEGNKLIQDALEREQ
jgi:hypothetical protein